MAALTVAREIALYYIIECPYSTQYNETYGNGTIAQTTDVAGSAKAVRTLVTAYLTNYIYPTPALQTELETLLDDWLALGYDVSVLENGSVGNVTGLSDSAAAEREEIARRVRTLVPFWHAFSDMLAGGKAGGGAFVPIVR